MGWYHLANRFFAFSPSLWSSLSFSINVFNVPFCFLMIDFLVYAEALYVNDTSFIGNSPSYTKTNIKALNSIKLSSTQQRIVVVLKKWKTKNDLPISSHLLQNLILDAYAYAPRTPRTFTAELMMVIKHIANNLDVAVIRGIENTNNIITDIPRADKDLVIRICKEAVEDYEYQPNSVLETFGILG